MVDGTVSVNSSETGSELQGSCLWLRGGTVRLRRSFGPLEAFAKVAQTLAV